MRAVIQRVKSASVKVNGELVSEIRAGLLIFLGISHDDTETELDYIANKVANLRIFEDADGKMNCSLLDIGGSALVVSQFTLYGDCRKGRRPSFINAARPEVANTLYEQFITCLKATQYHNARRHLSSNDGRTTHKRRSRNYSVG